MADKPDNKALDVADHMAALRAWGSKRPGTDLAAQEAAATRVEKQRELERSPPKKTDGRSLRATGRTEQFNIKVKPAWRDEIAGLAEARGIGMAELLERIVAEWKSLGGKAVR